MSKNRILMAAVSALLLTPALAMADEIEVVNGEAGIIFHDSPSTVTRDQVRAELRSSTTVAADGWTYVGGEAVWAAPQSRLVVQDGQLVHASDCPFSVATNTGSSRSAAPLPNPIYTGA